MDRGARSVVCATAVAFLMAACSAGSGAGLSQPSGSATTVAPHGNPCAEGYPSAQPTPHYPPASGRPLARSLARSLDSVLADLPDVGRRSGLTAAVVTDRGTWVGVAGHALDGSRLRRSSSLAIGSVTKTFTAAEVLHLVAAGRIDLRRRISAFVPRPVTDNGATVLDLLDMHSGIRDYVDQSLIVEINRRPAAHLTPDDALSFVPREVDKAGAFFEYSNTNYILLGQLVEKITGVSYAAALHRDLLGPAGLDRVAVQDEDRARDVTGPDPYLPGRAFASVAWAAGGIAADARSVAAWGYLLYGGRLADADCLAQMPARGPRQYGLGTDSFRARSSSLEFVGHIGEIGPYRSSLIAVRGQPISVAVLTVSEGAMDPMATADALAAVLVP
jgi:D-alanyl-D-alanine carboxypeptidase